MLSRTLKFGFIFTGILLVLSITYSSVLMIPYIYHDDAIFWFKTSNSPYHLYHAFNFFLGRFLGAFILSGFHNFVQTIADLNIIRFLSLIQISLCGTLCVWLLQRYLSSLFQSFLVTIIIFTLPPFQIFVSYAGIAYATTAIPLSGLACLAASRISIETPYLKRVLNAFTILSILLLILALSIYQSAAMFYWAIVMLFFLSYSAENFQNLKQHAINFFGVGSVGIAIYFLILKFSNFSNGQFSNQFYAYDSGKYEKFFIDKLTWFTTTPLFNSLNLWNVFPNTLYAAVVVGFILLSYALWFLKITKKSTKSDQNAAYRHAIFFTVLFFSLLFLSFLPNLVSAQHAPYYRCCAGLTTLVAIALLWGLNQWATLFSSARKKIILTITLCVICTYAVVKTNQNLLNLRAIPSQIELNYLESFFRQAKMGSYKQVHIIYKDPDDVKSRYDEFAHPTTYFLLDARGMINYFLTKWASEDRLVILYINWNYVSERVSLIDCVFMDPLNRSRFAYRMKFSHGEQSEKIDFEKPTLVIDMTKLYEPSGSLAYLNLITSSKP